MNHAVAFRESPLPGEGTGRDSYFILLLSEEEFSFIRVYGHDTFLTIGVYYPECAGKDLYLYTDDLPHGAAPVPQRWHTKVIVRDPFFAG